MSDSPIIRARAAAAFLRSATSDPVAARDADGTPMMRADLATAIEDLLHLIEALTGGDLGVKAVAAVVRLLGKVDPVANPLGVSMVGCDTDDPGRMLGSAKAVVVVAITRAKAPLVEFCTRGGIADQLSIGRS